MELIQRFSAYLILSGLNVFGVCLVLVSLYLAYRRRVAVQIGLTFLFGAVVLNTLTFFLGKEGPTLANSLWVVGIGGPTVVATLLFLCKRLITPIVALRGAVMAITAGSRQIQAGAESLSQGASEQASSTEEVSSTMEEMAATIRQNADNANQMKQTATHAADDALKSGETVAEMVAAMQTIEKRIILIDSITNQTRMLSLNATIEAAKAQEYGRGFAVVASEVRSLAAQSQAAANEISELTHAAVALANKASDMLKRLVPDIQKTAEISQEISAASEEQSAGIQQVALAIQQLDQVTQQNAAMAEELTATAVNFTGQATRLGQTVKILDRDTQDRQADPSVAPVEPKRKVSAQHAPQDELDAEFEKF